MKERRVITRKISVTLTDDEHLRLLVLLRMDIRGEAGLELDPSIDLAGLYGRVMDAWLGGVSA